MPRPPHIPRILRRDCLLSPHSPPSLLLGNATSPRRTASAEASTTTITAVDGRSARWRAVSTLLANLDVDDRRLLVVRVSDANATLAAGGPWERRDEAAARGFESRELQERAGLVPHDLNLLDRAKALRQSALEGSIGDSLNDTLVK